ncbi:hypothetical protein ACLMJK_007963 [Lecanora helva]
MAPATEIATLPLASGADIEDSNSPAGKVWQSTLDTVSDQPGFQRAYYGRQIENSSVLQLLVDWDSVEAHQNFIKSPIYGPFGKNVMSILDGSLTMLHAHFDPHPPSAAASSTNSGVTEILTAYLTSQDTQFEENAKKLIGILKEQAEGFMAASSGWVVEDVEDESFGAGKKGKAYVAVIGWESLKAHKKLRDSQCFRDNIHLLREGPVKTEMHHTRFVEK